MDGGCKLQRVSQGFQVVNNLTELVDDLWRAHRAVVLPERAFTRHARYGAAGVGASSDRFHAKFPLAQFWRVLFLLDGGVTGLTAVPGNEGGNASRQNVSLPAGAPRRAELLDVEYSPVSSRDPVVNVGIQYDVFQTFQDPRHISVEFINSRVANAPMLHRVWSQNHVLSLKVFDDVWLLAQHPQPVRVHHDGNTAAVERQQHLFRLFQDLRVPPQPGTDHHARPISTELFHPWIELGHHGRHRTALVQVRVNDELRRVALDDGRRDFRAEDVR
mmetsp:Transcript_4032/g.11553  ORF Transcript_4032/g.11553 Transcript_4032/m.11553 type:complete len:274 (-) Transcript_4032:2685-3506(-)